MQNMFWKIEGIPGESTSEQGKGMIELLSHCGGVSMPLTNGGSSNTSRATGRCVHQDFTVSKYVDLATPLLNLKCCGGEDIKLMSIHLWKADAAGKPLEFMTYTFESCIVTSVSVSGSGGEAVETVTFNYSKVTWEYNQQVQEQPGGKKGKTVAGWNCQTNSGK